MASMQSPVIIPPMPTLPDPDPDTIPCFILPDPDPDPWTVEIYPVELPRDVPERDPA